MSEVERKLRANDRDYNLSFKYAVSINVLLLVSLPLTWFNNVTWIHLTFRQNSLLPYFVRYLL